jgi:nucleotide-binding universal stress UspA family protein
MKKVLAVFDGAHFSESSLQFISRLNELSPVLLTGVFLPSIDYSDVMVYYLSMSGPLYYPEIVNDQPAMDANIRKFEAYCQKHHIEYRIHSDAEAKALPAIQKETRYADLLVLSNELFYENLGEISQKEYLKGTLHKTECPIILVPEEYRFPKSVIIAYDGSETSVFAMKQFAYLFPELANLSTLVVYATTGEEAMPDMPYMKELTARHFKDVSFYKLEADPKRYFSTWVADKGDALLVSGSFGRSGFSELLHQNFSWQVIRDHKLPVFMAHL